jgi:hypothetical protein
MSLHSLALYTCTQQPIIARAVAGSAAAVAALRAAGPEDIAEDIVVMEDTAAVAGHTVMAAHTAVGAHIALAPAVMAAHTAVDIAVAIVGAAPKAIAEMVERPAMKMQEILTGSLEQTRHLLLYPADLATGGRNQRLGQPKLTHSKTRQSRQ